MGIFILKKAFDIVDHWILLKKFDLYGIRDVSGDFLRSYLSNRVPQKSVLGPIFFNLYIHDLMNVSNNFKYVLFADNTNILYSDTEIKNVQRTVNKDQDKIHHII